MKKYLIVGLIAMLMSTYVLSTEVLEVDEIASGIFVHFGKQQLSNPSNHGAIANIGFIVGSRCVAVIDSGGSPQQGRALKITIQERTALPICYVINSHVHPDHIFGNSAFKASGVKFVGHHKLARAMQLRSNFYRQRSLRQIGVTLADSDIVLPDLQVKDKLTLDLGNRRLILTAHKSAHTDNDLSIYDIKTDTWWLADLLFQGHLPVLDGSLKGWLQALKQIKQRQAKIVVPGHGLVVSDWPVTLQLQQSYLQMLFDEVALMISKGKFIEEAIATVGLQAKNKWQLFADLHRKNVATAFAELEWED